MFVLSRFSFCSLFACVVYLFVLEKIVHRDRAPTNKRSDSIANIDFGTFKHLPEIEFERLETHDKLAVDSFRNCTLWDCLDVYKCGRNGYGRITIFIYPLRKITIDGNRKLTAISKEFYEILQTIRSSKYYTNDASKACLFVPSFDLLNLHGLDPVKISRILHQLPYWNNGHNHLLFNMVRDRTFLESARFGKAMLLTSGLDSLHYRLYFDIAIPMFSPGRLSQSQRNRKWLVLMTQTDIENRAIADKLQPVADSNPTLFLIAGKCNGSIVEQSRCRSTTVYPYPDLLATANFCLVFNAGHVYGLYQTLFEILASNCVPVIVADFVILPFQSVLDWKKIAIFFSEHDFVNDLIPVLKSFSGDFIADLQRHGSWIFNEYFASIDRIAATSLQILQDRIFPVTARSYFDWNSRADERKFLNSYPIENLNLSGYDSGYTAVILAYNRVKSLFQLVTSLSQSPSLSKIVVVWNNQKESPPHQSLWPKIAKPLEIIVTKANKLTNRFRPYREIETVAVLSIDDDITMLTIDELEFGFQIWTENPDRIVGFPSRTHYFDNETNGRSNAWKYESEWKNEISMVLTGAAFLHKYYLHEFTTRLPTPVRAYVDANMNCEDIAMNFVVANLTHKAPLKISARKKFKCSECVFNEMLSESGHYMKQRTECINYFETRFGSMPLVQTEYRADPVLFKTALADQIRLYRDIGKL